MGSIKFHKYQGTGNDFIMIDDRNLVFDENRLDLISSWCHRKFGIGADGVILIRNHKEYDFEMVYFNPDGSKSLCGNGSRCAVKFAYSLGMIGEKCSFLAIDGPHEGAIKQNEVQVKLHDVGPPTRVGEDYFIDTGSPHHVKMVSEVSTIDIIGEGSTIRNSERYRPAGANVNFVQPSGDEVRVRTFERGVENETLSCGTGVTAVALVMGFQGYESPVNIAAMGGPLAVTFDKHTDGSYTNIWLSGGAEQVFEGVISY